MPTPDGHSEEHERARKMAEWRPYKYTWWKKNLGNKENHDGAGKYTCNDPNAQGTIVYICKMAASNKNLRKMLYRQWGIFEECADSFYTLDQYNKAREAPHTIWAELLAESIVEFICEIFPGPVAPHQSFEDWKNLPEKKQQQWLVDRFRHYLNAWWVPDCRLLKKNNKEKKICMDWLKALKTERPTRQKWLSNNGEKFIRGLLNNINSFITQKDLEKHKKSKNWNLASHLYKKSLGRHIFLAQLTHELKNFFFDIFPKKCNHPNAANVVPDDIFEEWLQRNEETRFDIFPKKCNHPNVANVVPDDIFEKWLQRNKETRNLLNLLLSQFVSNFDSKRDYIHQGVGNAKTGLKKQGQIVVKTIRPPQQRQYDLYTFDLTASSSPPQLNISLYSEELIAIPFPQEGWRLKKDGSIGFSWQFLWNFFWKETQKILGPDAWASTKDLKRWIYINHKSLHNIPLDFKKAEISQTSNGKEVDDQKGGGDKAESADFFFQVDDQKENEGQAEEESANSMNFNNDINLNDECVLTGESEDEDYDHGRSETGVVDGNFTGGQHNYENKAELAKKIKKYTFELIEKVTACQDSAKNREMQVVLYAYCIGKGAVRSPNKLLMQWIMNQDKKSGSWTPINDTAASNSLAIIKKGKEKKKNKKGEVVEERVPGLAEAFKKLQQSLFNDEGFSHEDLLKMLQQVTPCLEDIFSKWRPNEEEKNKYKGFLSFLQNERGITPLITNKECLN